ncbi:MAG: PAS domain-containing protein [Flavobacteriales bacterium]|nr:PAS domain-containing protein [Flavobacteriales bacterium]
MKMNTRQKHWFFFMVTAIGAIAVVNLAILIMWTDMNEEEREFGRQMFGRVVTYGSLAMVIVFFFSSQFILYIFRNYISPIETLAEETRLISVANAKYRIKPVGALETHNLTSVINDLADAYISLKSDVKNIVTESKEGFEEEKLRLEALMNIISEGVIICNHDGRIMMANHQAYEILNAVEHNEVGRFSRLGLGRSLFGVFNRTPIVYALEELHSNLKKEGRANIYHFITTRYKVQYLNVKISSILKNKDTNSVSGYVITFNDITNDIQENKLEPYKNQHIILDEIASIVNMRTKNQFNFITESGIWVNINHQFIIDFLIELSTYLKKLNVKTISIGLSSNNKLQINWKGNEANFKSNNEKFNNLILHQNTIANHSKIKLDVSIYKQESELSIKDPKESRPVFYNSDLFDHSAQSTDMDDVLLRDLTFVVFDTETTGLDPSGGDEIISIAGVRVFEGKINNEEMFDELVNPQRNIPLISLEIHEIYPEMLTDKPTIDKILPMFHEFADNAILVAHNAAFDMRFFQLKEAQTGIKFENPVLDTLLLSEVCNPKQELHNLEDIAEKCGVEIIGRHTALGDSLVTAEVFLKLIPILEANGIKTLGEARKASQKTALSKIKF